METHFNLLSRRAALRRIGGVSAIAASSLGLGRTGQPFADSVAVESIPASIPAPAPQLRTFDLVASEFDWSLMADTTVRAWGYNGQVPGPELRVREGDQVRVTLRNQLPVPTTIHWHGVNLPPAMDGPAGLNQAPVAPGDEFVYDFIATPAGSRWYHSHVDPALQVPLGLYGSLVIEPQLPVASWNREYTLILGEWDLELTPAVASGAVERGPGDRLLRGGELGADLFVINGHLHGSVPPIRVAEGERILLRLIHAGAIPHPFHIHGHSFTIVATDGNPVPVVARLTKDTILIAPGERYDLELVANNPGVWMVHCHIEHHMANGMMTLIAYDGAVPTGPAAAYFDHVTGSLGGDPDSAHTMHPMPASEAPDAPPAPTAPDHPPAAAREIVIAMVDDRFEPNAAEVAAGTTVTWVSQGTNWHSVAAYDGSFESPRLASGESYATRLDQPGLYQYICKHHGLQGMLGRITVT